MRSIFRRSATRKFSIYLFLLLLAIWLGALPPQTGFTSDNARQMKLVVKTAGRIGQNDSALWIRNLSTRNTRFAVENGLEQSQGFSTGSESLEGDKMLRLDESLLETLRGSNELLIHSDEQVAAIVAPAELPIGQSEFYYYQQPHEGMPSQVAPKWVIDLGAVGKSGANVLKANGAGYAPAITTKSENGRRYRFGVGVALRRENSSAEIKLINKAGQVMRSLELSGPADLYWRTELGEFISGADDFLGRIEMNVLAGKAQGFLSVRDVETDEEMVLPIAPMGRRAKGIRAMAGGPYGGGYASFTQMYSCPYSAYSYVVTDAPPNTCGTLKLVRNGVYQETPGWICTDSTGAATKGPWSVSKTETVQSVRIEWPDGSRTYGGDTHIDDNTAPSIWANQSSGPGVPIPTSFSGGGSDPQWGTGFKFGPGGWSYLYATFYDFTSKLYWNGSCYCSSTRVNFDATASPPAGGSSFTWSVASPPPQAHTSSHTYIWCIYSKDWCFGEFNCLYFYP